MIDEHCEIELQYTIPFVNAKATKGKVIKFRPIVTLNWLPMQRPLTDLFGMYQKLVLSFTLLFALHKISCNEQVQQMQDLLVGTLKDLQTCEFMCDHSSKFVKFAVFQRVFTSQPV